MRHPPRPALPARLGPRRLAGPLGAVVGLLALSTAGPAAGQTTPMNMGACSGTLGGKMITGTISLVVRQKDGNGNEVDQLVDPSNLVGLNECQCGVGSNKLFIQIRMTSPAPFGQSQGVALFIGGGVDCVDQTTRSTSPCQEVTAADFPAGTMLGLDYANFQQSSSAFNIPLNPKLLADPKSMSAQDRDTHVCEAHSDVARTISILLGDLNSPPATCKLNTTVRTVPPPEASDINVTPGDGALNLTWNTPVNSGIKRYQVLCRKHNSDQPIPELRDKGYRAWYSTCNGTTLNMRYVPPVGTGTTPTADGGTSSDGGSARAEVRTEGIGPPGRTPQADDMASPDDMAAPPDMATPDMTALDLKPPADMLPATGYAALDPAFLCSDVITPGGTGGSIRIDGLENLTEYDVTLVAIDNFGNPTGSARGPFTPQAAQNLAEALHGSGNFAGGFGCAVSGSGVGAGAGLLTLAALALLARRRRASSVTDKVER